MQHDDQASSEQSLTALTADIVAAYVSNNAVAITEIGGLIGDVSRQLHALDQPPQQEPAKPAPAVPIRRSIGSDRLICLVCGQKQRMLKRHLTAEHQLSPDKYRRLFDLKPDYPMVAPSYATMRRELALRIGLGRPKHAPANPAAPETTSGPKKKRVSKRATAAPAKAPARGRRPKASAG